jgi:hypothetical protein
MVTKSKNLGRRYDGGKSPLCLPPVKLSTSAMSIDAPCSQEDIFHLAQPNKWAETAQQTYDSVLGGSYRAGLNAWCDQKLVGWGLTPEKISKLSEVSRTKLCNKLVRAARHVMEDRNGEILKKILNQTKPDPTVPGASIDKEDTMMNTRGGLPRHLVQGVGGSEASKRERTMLHVSLREWAKGELKLEHPQASSWHHMVTYEMENSTSGDPFPATPQLFVVERDWARAFAGYDLSEGDSPLPFEYCCFEFRISGVRVLAVYQEHYDEMFCVYGRGGVWVCDDFLYSISTGHGRPVRTTDINEFPRVAKLVRDNVRVACIMIDADIAKAQPRQASEHLVAKRRKEGRAPPRDHYVIDLKRRHVPSPGTSHYVASAGGQHHYQMRGHFRRGTWVHYPDPESGRVKYTDDTGAERSRTWRHWHFAGDPNNIIHREYRL